MKKIALITGASRGIGRAIALRLSGGGWQVAVNYVNSEKQALNLAGEISGIAVRADVSDAKQVDEMFRRIETELGTVSLLVNNAGISDYGLFSQTTPKQRRQVLAVNVEGVFNCCQRAVDRMICEHAGIIINISSIWGQIGASCEAVYSASKAAVIGFTKALAKELGPCGIRVNCVAPGCIETDMLNGFSDSDLASLKEQTPLGTIGKPEDIASAVSFLASENSRFITGQILAPNGGLAT